MPRRDTLWGFGLRFLGSLLPLFLLGWGLAPAYAAAVFSAANFLFEFAWEHPPTARVRVGVEGGGDLGYVYYLSPDGPQPVFAFEKYGLFFNGVFLVAAILAAPGMRGVDRAVRAGVGMGLLALVHVLFVVVEVRAQFLNRGLLSAGSVEAYAIHWLAVLFGPLGEGLFPLLIVGVLTGRAWKDALGLAFPSSSSRGRTRPVGRNDPCPCGSGRKFKRCCGKSRR